MNTSTDWATNDQALARLALACLDLTELGDTCSAADVAALCAKAQGHLPGNADKTPALPQVAAVCVWPAFVAQARAALPNSIRVAAVVNFPSGDQPVDAVCAQVQQIRDGGGQEVDCVLPHRAWMAGERETTRALVRAVRMASEGLTLKLILESGAFTDDVLLRDACDMALVEGVDFLKTSTGKIAQGASLSAADVLLSAAAAHPARDRLGFKPSGGIRTVADVRAYALAVQSHLGDAALVPARFRIGASALWTDIARVLGQTAAVSNATY
jgi:deoxyribose-phosphate aldolase